MAYEAEFALLFYLWGSFVFLGDWKKHAVRSVLWSMALFFLAFNSYNAMKLVYIPLLFLLLWYRRNDIKGKKHLIAAMVWGVLTTISVFIYFSLVQGASVHGGEFLIFQDTGVAAQAVELARRASSAPHALQVLYHNKLTYFVDVISRHYLYAFSPDFLFLSQEGSGIYSLWSRGNLYLIELPLLLIGIFSLWKKQKSVFIFGMLAMIIAALPSAIGPAPFTYATRASFMLPWLALFIAFGIYILIQKIRILAIVVIVLYAYYIGGYLNQYYFEWPRYSAKSYAKDQKDLVAFITSYPDTKATFLITNVSDMFFLQYAFYTRMDPKILQDAFRRTPNLTRLGSMTISSSCIAPKDNDPRAYVPVGTVYMNQSCYSQNPDYGITLPDGEQMWHIYKGTGVL